MKFNNNIFEGVFRCQLFTSRFLVYLLYSINSGNCFSPSKITEMKLIRPSWHVIYNYYRRRYTMYVILPTASWRTLYIAALIGPRTSLVDTCWTYTLHSRHKSHTTLKTFLCMTWPQEGREGRMDYDSHRNYSAYRNNQVLLDVK